MAGSDTAPCGATREVMPAYVAEELSLAARERVDGHVAACAECRASLDTLQDAARLSCQELVELVTDYLEDRLPLVERARFEAHLLLCPGCRTYLDQLGATIRLTGRLAADEVPPEARRELLGVFRAWKRG